MPSEFRSSSLVDHTDQPFQFLSFLQIPMRNDTSTFLCTLALASFCYCYFISSRIPKGFSRLASLLPVFYLSTILPLRLPTATVTTTALLFITSLVNYKLPAKPNYPERKPISWSYLALETFLYTASLGSLLIFNRSDFHPFVVLLFDCFLAFLTVDILGFAANLMLYATVGIELKPSSDKPYFSTSLQDFWGRRWNVAVTNNLRRTIYLPVRSMSAGFLGQRLAPLAAVLVTFMVSGLTHELFFYYLTRAKPTWEMTSFFALHGFCVALEVAVKKAVKGRWHLPGWVSVPLTIGFMLLTGYWLFFPPLNKSGLDSIVYEEFRTSVEFVQNELQVHFRG